jgi:hypothetical protein
MVPIKVKSIETTPTIATALFFYEKSLRIITSDGK